MWTYFVDYIIMLKFSFHVSPYPALNVHSSKLQICKEACSPIVQRRQSSSCISCISRLSERKIWLDFPGATSQVNAM